MLDTYYKLIDSVVTELGIDLESTRGAQAGQWNLRKGRFDIMVDVWEQDNYVLFQVVSPLCTLPDENREEFLMYLLQKNYGMSGVAYCIMENSVFLKYTTEAYTLSKESIIAVLNKTAFYAEMSNFVPTAQ